MTGIILFGISVIVSAVFSACPAWLFMGLVTSILGEVDNWMTVCIWTCAALIYIEFFVRFLMVSVSVVMGIVVPCAEITSEL